MHVTAIKNLLFLFRIASINLFLLECPLRNDINIEDVYACICPYIHKCKYACF